MEQLEQEIAGLHAETERVAEEARELAGEVPLNLEPPSGDGTRSVGELELLSSESERTGLRDFE